MSGDLPSRDATPATGALNDLRALLSDLRPVLNEGVFVFATLPAHADPGSFAALAMFREAEAVTVIVGEDEARRANLPVLFRAAWITLAVRSDLQAVGLTAAVSAALSSANISCNVVAAAHHDHLFVPVDDARAALEALQALQRAAHAADVADERQHAATRWTEPSGQR